MKLIKFTFKTFSNGSVYFGFGLKGLKRPSYYLLDSLLQEMRLWALLVFVGVVYGEGNRTKRQFEAGHCDPAFCQIPDCYCGGNEIPGGFSPDQIPQFVLLTFDDAVNDLNEVYTG